MTSIHGEWIEFKGVSSIQGKFSSIHFGGGGGGNCQGE